VEAEGTEVGAQLCLEESTDVKEEMKEGAIAGGAHLMLGEDGVVKWTIRDSLSARTERTQRDTEIEEAMWGGGEVAKGVKSLACR